MRPFIVKLGWGGRFPLDNAGGDEDLLRDEALLVHVVDDRADVGHVEHRVGDEEPEHAGPEVVVLEVGPEAGGDDRPRQPLVAAESVDLAPAQRRLDRAISRGLHEVVGHPLRVRQRQVRRADVLAPTDVPEPRLLLDGPRRAPLNQTESMKAGTGQRANRWRARDANWRRALCVCGFHSSTGRSQSAAWWASASKPPMNVLPSSHRAARSPAGWRRGRRIAQRASAGRGRRGRVRGQDFEDSNARQTVFRCGFGDLLLR